MVARDDFQYSIKRAAALTQDATCALRAVRKARLPAPHDRLVGRAIVHLERAQQEMFTAHHDPWRPPPKPTHQQLELL
jgi:hypothetical protein